MPLMASPEVSDEMAKRVESFFLGLNTNEVLEKYRPLMKQVKLKVIPVTEADYQSFMDLIESSMDEGWDMDFEAWLSSARELK